MRIHFYGAAHTVTGSKHLLEINGRYILLECGFFQGKRTESYEKNLTFPFDPKKLSAVILSHAHIDHSGNLPNLVKQGFNGLIYTTGATARLADIMLQDSGHIQEADAVFVNKKRARRGEPPVEPIYTLADAVKVAPLFKKLNYNQVIELLPGVQVHLVDAGHILGSAAVVLDITENGNKKRLWFSGDIGRLKLPLLPDPVLPEAVDYLMMECTYGDKTHSDPEEAYVEFRQVVAKTIRNGGKVIIPAFAVGRTQELVYFLNRMVTTGDLPRVPVYVDSPLAVNATRIFQEFPEYFDAETLAFVRSGRHPALNFDGLTYTRSVEESKALNGRKDPMIIISASGMAESGRILHHLRNNIEDPRNTILIVGWQAPDTLGRRLAERAPRVSIFGEEYERRAGVETIGGLSAHAGQDFLLKYARASRASLKGLFLVHGEQDSVDAFTAKLKEDGAWPVHYPAAGDVAEI
jgi:metallo-beta-lactamase family protein